MEKLAVVIIGILTVFLVAMLASVSYELLTERPDPILSPMLGKLFDSRDGGPFDDRWRTHHCLRSHYFMGFMPAGKTAFYTRIYVCDEWGGRK